MSDEVPRSGIYYNDPDEDNKFDWKLGKISIHVDTLSDCIKWAMSSDLVSEKGYLRFDLLLSKAGKKYVKLNDWKPKRQTEESDNLPF